MYSKIEELPEKFPDMMKTLLPLLDVNTSGLPKLAVLPVQMQGGAGDATNQRDADTLAQILAIGLLRNKRYAIYPRTSSLEQVQKEFDTQRSGVTADKNAAQSGYGVNPEYVLSVTSRKLGEMNMFNAAIIDMAEGTMLQGTSEDYGTLIDGMAAMESIAITLSGGEMSPAEIEQRKKEEEARIAAAAKEEAARIAEEERVEKERIAEEQRAEAARKAAINRDKFLRESGVTLGVNMGISVIGGDLDAQIFGEPKPITVESSDPDAKASSIGYSGGLSVALRHGKYFAIQSGVNFNLGFNGPSKLEYTYLQVPVLLRLNFTLGTIDLGIFGGPAFNFPMSASSTVSFSGSSYAASQTATMTLPMSGTVGGDLSLKLPSFGGIITYIGAQYTFDFGDTTVKLADGHEGTFKRSSVDMIMGFKFYIPFKR
jgi:TolB-like protein